MFQAAKSPIRIRLLRESDLGFADTVRACAGWNQTPQDWQRLLRHDPDGCFLAEWQGRPAGTVTTTVYSPDLAWIGMLLVHPECRRRGIGQALLNTAIQSLTDKGIRCLKLDATPAGQPLYEKIGFKTEWTLRRWELQGPPPAQQSTGGHMRPVQPTDHQTLIQLDAQAFGLPRPRWLLDLVAQSRHTLICSDAAETTCGFAILRQGMRAAYLGPVVSTSSPVAASLIFRALELASEQACCYWDVPDPNRIAVELAVQGGFREQRRLTRMYLGEPPPPGRVEALYGITGPETG